MPESGPNPSESSPPRPPPAIPDHELIGRIGRGSYGEVWLARNHTGSLRAVKLIRRDAFDDGRPYEREFTGLRNFEPLSREHDGLVDILQVGRNDAEGWFYSIMELADGVKSERSDGVMEKGSSGVGLATQHSTLRSTTPTLQAPACYRPLTLESRIRAEGRLPVQECIRIATKLAEALRFLHDRGLVHRDIKPSNIVFVGGVPKLADVGLVARTESARTFVGTEGFVPPEGPGTPGADLYSLGKCLYEMAMGKDRQAFPSPPTKLDELPERATLLALNDIITKACDPNPARRYRIAEDLCRDLERVAVGRFPLAGRNRTRRWLIAGLVVLLACGGFWFARHRATLVLDHDYAPPAGATILPEGIQDYAGDGIVRLLTIGPDNALKLVSAEGRLIAEGSLPRGSTSVGAALVAAESSNQPPRLYVSWHEDDRAVLGRFNARLQELRASRVEVPLSYHTNDAGVRHAETWLAPRLLYAPASSEPPQLLVTLMTGRPLWPRELRCYDADNMRVRWSLPWAAKGSETPPVLVTGLAREPFWLIGSVSNDNGAELPDGDSDRVSCLRAISTDGTMLWRLPVGGVFSGCEPLVTGSGGQQRIFALVRRWADVYWLSTNTIPALGRVLEVSPDSRELRHHDAPAGVEFSSLRSLETGGAGGLSLLATDSQGWLHVLDENLNPVQKLRVAAAPATNCFVQMYLAPPADLDGDGQPELCVLYSTVEFLSGRDLSHDSEPNNRLYHDTTLVIYDAQLRRRASRLIEEENSVARWHLRVLPPSRTGTRELVVVGPTARFYRYRR